MSFPSVVSIALARGVDLAALVPGNPEHENLGEEILAEAIKTDLPLAWEYLHGLVHQADKAGETVSFVEDPASPLGKQIIRIAASDAARAVVTKHAMHGRKWVFINCCNGLIPPKGQPKPCVSVVDQIHYQDGTHAHADC